MGDNLLPQHFDHRRTFRDNRYVYPVLSRRSHGLSVGVNLNPDKICNFDCIYCQVDRRTDSELRFVEMDRLVDEVEWILDWIVSGQIYKEPGFASVPDHLRRLNDIAFSGDGEPTTFRNFDEIVTRVAEVKASRNLDETRMVLITNASMFHREVVRRGLDILDQNNGEIWAKLDAGTSEYYHLVDRTPIPFQQVLDNIASASQVRPLVIQSLFLEVDGVGPSDDEVAEYCKRLNEFVSSGGQIRLVQVYTVARRPAESYVGPLSDSSVDRIGEEVRSATSLDCECFYGGSIPAE